MRAVDLCPDAQSPELSVPCQTPTPGPSPGVAPTPSPDIDFLPWTGTAWFWLLLGIAIGAIIVGLILLWYRRRDDDDDQAVAAVVKPSVPFGETIREMWSRIVRGS